MMCEFCGRECGLKKDDPAVMMTHGGTSIGMGCFDCADSLSQEVMIPLNVEGGGSVEATANGYMRWRSHLGKPCSLEHALEVVRESLAKAAKAKAT